MSIDTTKLNNLHRVGLDIPRLPLSPFFNSEDGGFFCSERPDRGNALQSNPDRENLAAVVACNCERASGGNRLNRPFNYQHLSFSGSNNPLAMRDNYYTTFRTDPHPLWIADKQPRLVYDYKTQALVFLFLPVCSGQR